MNKRACRARIAHAHTVLPALAVLAATLSGCFSVYDHSNKLAQPALVPLCDALAPSHLEYYVREWDDAGARATANLMVDRGWSNVTKDAWRISGDCAPGQMPAVSAQDQIDQAAARQAAYVQGVKDTARIGGGAFAALGAFMLGAFTRSGRYPTLIALVTFEALVWQAWGVHWGYLLAAACILLGMLAWDLRKASGRAP